VEDNQTTEYDETVLLSAIEHYSYCPRQCALIHVEQIYEENIFTMRGTLAHERVDSGEDDDNRGVKTLRAIPLWSDRYGLRGKADVVEMRAEGPYPIEYKSGKRHNRHSEYQLCAQAICLEEMLGVAVPRGAVYMIGARRRYEVQFTAEMRRQTLDMVAAIRALQREQRVPEAPNDERCPNCSLINVCMPFVVAESARLRGLQGALFSVRDVGEDADA
jgi:CRISPR-associated exonuclease Cas4